MTEVKMSHPRQMESGFREIEATLVICSENPLVVARQIANMASIAGYQLLPQDSKTIHDLYFDTPDRLLQAQKLALRVRKSDEKYWIALKGRSRSIEGVGLERLEIEAPWSEDALTMVLKKLKKKLKRRRIGMPQQCHDFDHVFPIDVMDSLGLKIIQDRESHREVRNIVFSGEESSPVLAEMAIDSVIYHFSGRQICHREVEIESKVRNGSTVLKAVTSSLVAMYGPVLRKWDHSKLATGKAIEKLLSEGALNGLLDSNGNLKPVAYDKIDDYLKCNSV